MVVFAVAAVVLMLWYYFASRKDYETLKGEALTLIEELDPPNKVRLKSAVLRKREKLLRMQDAVQFLLSEGLKL